MADLRLGENIVVPAIVVKEEVVPSYMPPRAIINGILKNPNAITSYSSAPITDIDSYVLVRAFYNCTNLITADLSSLTTISGSSALSSCFQNCRNLTSVDLSSLETISGSSALSSCFSGCRKLTELRFPALKSFGTNTSTVNQFNTMLSDVTGCTLHFPVNMQSEVERRTGYPNFGGTNTVVLFDLPPTA